ncbi:MAG: hypothetical protein RLZZ337_335 [Bacteroidota bacterium]|jgi:cytochrome c5
MKIVSFVIVICSIALVGCFANKVVVENSSADIVAKAQEKFPGYTVEQFEIGKQLYETKCNLCHGLKVPKNYSDDEWAKLVPRMAKKANDKKNTGLTEEDQMLIYNYVIAMR